MCHVKELSILGIVTLDLYAISQGIDGVLLLTVLSLLAGIAGHEFRIYREGGRKKIVYYPPDELME